jgi:hypothetical protein
MAKTIAQGTAVEAFEACRREIMSMLTVEANGSQNQDQEGQTSSESDTAQSKEPITHMQQGL